MQEFCIFRDFSHYSNSINRLFLKKNPNKTASIHSYGSYVIEELLEQRSLLLILTPLV